MRKQINGFGLWHSGLVIKSYHVVVEDRLGIPFESLLAVPCDRFGPWTIVNKLRTEFRFVSDSIFRSLSAPTMPSMKLAKCLPISAMQIFELLINFKSAWMKTIAATMWVTDG